MRRHFASSPAALAAPIVSLGMYAGAAVADGPSPAGSPTAAVSTATTEAPAATTTSSTTSSATPTTTTPTRPGKPAKPTTPTKPTAPTAPAAKARAKLYLTGTFTVAKNEVTVPGRPVEVQGFVRPFVAGQKVKVQSFLGRKLI